jgi:hypothetical protein
MLIVKKPDPTRGTIQWISERDVQPYQNKQIGSAKAPKKVGGRITSGLIGGGAELRN